MAQDALDHLALIDEGDDAHLARARRTNQRVGLPHLLDELAPFRRWWTPGAVFGDINDFDPVGGRLPFPAFSLLVALSAHLIRIPAIVAHELKILIRDMLGDGGNKVAGGKDFKVAPDLGVHAGAVDDGAGFRIGMHLVDGEGVADDVLREPFEILFLMRLHALAAVDAKAGVLPAQEHPGTVGRQEPFIHQKGDGAGAEELFEWADAGLRQNMEPAAALEKSVGNKCM